jgi:transcriptional regulator with XRE-family HTH domain
MSAARKRKVRSGAADAGGVGQRLRRERLKQQIGLRELARRIGVSPSLISQIETGKSEPSVSTLSAIVSELNLSLNEIVFADADPGSGHRRHGQARVDSPLPAAALSPVLVQQAANRRAIHLDSGVTWERLTAEPDPGVDFLHVTYDVGGASTASDRLMRHAGREYGFVISGHLRVSIAFDDFELAPGDSIAFDSTTPHRLANAGDEPVRAIWTVVGRGASTELHLPGSD